jgi:hypothetical protein
MHGAGILEWETGEEFPILSPFEKKKRGVMLLSVVIRAAQLTWAGNQDETLFFSRC